MDQQRQHTGPVAPPDIRKNLVPHNGCLLRRGPHPGHRPLKAPHLGLARMALIGDTQSLRESLGPAGLAAVGEQKQGDPRLVQRLLPGPHRLGGGVDSIGHQGVVQIGQQEANSPGPQPGQINGVDAFKIKIRDQRKFHGITF